MFPIFEVEFFGCRGSTPVSGSEFMKYGGNTTCIALYVEDTLLAVDCGTGLAPLQASRFNTGDFSSADIFLTHVHWDHIQGIPFFGPFFSPKCDFTIYGERRDGLTLLEQLRLAMRGPMFPVTPDALGARIDWREIECGDVIPAGGATVHSFRLRHPDVCTGYRFEYAGKSVCVVGDYEHGEPAPTEWAAGADALIYDAQYTDAEYPGKKGWGHSTWREACAFAKRCGAKRLYLTHHDPWRTDAQLAQMEQEAREVFPQTTFAREGLRVVLD